MWWRKETAISDSEMRVINRDRLNNEAEKQDETFAIPMITIYGWATSIVVFIIEIMSKYVSLNSIWNSCKLFLTKNNRRICC